jgi:hypothetical protein
MIDYDSEFKKLLRSLTLELFNDKDHFTYKKVPFWYYKIGLFYFKRKKIIKKISELGGILTGSRVLYLSEYRNLRIYTKKPNDFDFLVSEKDVFKITTYLESIGVKRCDHDPISYILFNDTSSYSNNDKYINLIIDKNLEDKKIVNIDGFKCLHPIDILKHKINVKDFVLKFKSFFKNE